VPNEMKTQLVKNLQAERGCFWMNKNLVIWDGPNNKGTVMLSKTSVAPFELDPELEGALLMRFTTRRMKKAFVRQCSRHIGKAFCLGGGFVDLPAAAFDEETPDLSSVQDKELLSWLMLL